jgi:1-acyl-sn-glycerol-3-phosphate acyltransferase
MFFYLVCQVLRVLAIVFFRLRGYGINNIPVKGGALLASNHQSYLDPVLVGLAVKRPVYFLARQELFDANRIFGWLLTQVHAIPLERRGFDSTGLRKAIEVLRQGGLLVVFPEGTRTPNGKRGDIKKGISLLGTRANVPFIPTLVQGTYQSWPRQHRFPIRLSRVSIKFEKPVWLDKNDISSITAFWDKMEQSGPPKRD